MDKDQRCKIELSKHLRTVVTLLNSLTVQRRILEIELSPPLRGDVSILNLRTEFRAVKMRVEKEGKRGKKRG